MSPRGEALRAAYAATDYRVRLSGGGTAHLRAGQPPPEPLRTLAGGRPWSVVTACNPRSQAMPRAWNHDAQRRLLEALRAMPQVRQLAAAVGGGIDGWREASFWVVGPEIASMLALATRFRQHAILAGRCDAPAALHWTPD